ncbi:(2Fe-2S)-binding protein [Acinetobacter suaedae]|uniref:(2Fe-2S)-binding protein n=1 Tax=Acinetobacter suaedae TaxID=2609668 RepID=A0A5P1UU78_9GAMM|nr:(2Fe-2S)-binding protein [Acinetobacter sp. C16S1]QER39722.1 (2Fe-2S)-binding protein [Acinetobacter sp. C16S1]
MNTCQYFQAELEISFSVLQQHLKLEIHCSTQQAITLADLFDDSICRQVLQDFATRIHAKNQRCATSLFIKYWATLWVLPFLYCQAASLAFVKWQYSAFVVELPETWSWERRLQLADSASDSCQIISLPELDAMLLEFNDLLQQIARVGRVSYALLWENVAVRVVQFYRSLVQQDLSNDMLIRLQQQQQLLKAKSAQSFNLPENPFLKLWDNWHPEFNTYMRQKCCFYFQLEEVGGELCRNCPLQLKKTTEMKS